MRYRRHRARAPPFRGAHLRLARLGVAGFRDTLVRLARPAPAAGAARPLVLPVVRFVCDCVLYVCIWRRSHLANLRHVLVEAAFRSLECAFGGVSLF